MATLRELRDVRLEKLEKIKKLGINPYPAKSNMTHHNGDLLSDFENLEGSEVVITGRLLSIRGHGKLMFMDLKDASGSVQLYVRSDNYGDSDYENGVFGYEDLELLDLGDFVEASGEVVKTKTGEISVDVKSIRLLTKSIRPMPDKWDGLKDKETRLRRRYLDTNINDEVHQRYLRRAKFWEAHRDFFKNREFVEINIPVLEHIPGGADANPFVTHMEAIDQDFYLRISQELYLKRLIGGGYERVYEIGPRFRNEGISDEHLPEHIGMEFYWAYASWEEGMQSIKDLFNHIVSYVYDGETKFRIRGFDVDFSNDWEIIDFAEVMKERFGIDVHDTNVDELKKVCEKHNIDGFEMNVHRSIDNLWKHIRKDIAGPAFLVNHPKYLSPLSKAHADAPHITERFQPVIAGSELGNGWSEINDPQDQLDRFLEQQNLRDAGDGEAQWLDIDYVEMLEYGMPPTFGYGHSERVFWFLEDVTAREGVPFPQLRHELDSTTKEIYGLWKDEPVDSISKNTSNGYTISQEVLQKFPEMTYAYVVISGVEVTKKNDELKELMTREIETAASVDLNQAISETPIKSYRNVMKETGTDPRSKKPSPEALLSRVVAGKGLYNINTAVDAYNLAVLNTLVGLGGFDLDKINGPVSLRFSSEGEEMLLLGESSTTSLREGQIVYSDQTGPITLDLNYRDIDRTKITESTKNIILFADGGPGISDKTVLSALEKGANNIQRFCGGEIGEMVLVNTHVSNLESEDNTMANISDDVSGLPSRDEAQAFLEEHVKDDYQLLHSKMVATALGEYAKELGENEDLWYLTGLLHDIDYFEHPSDHPNISVEWFKEKGYPEQLVHAVLAHAHDRTGVAPQTPLASALCAVDETSGLLYAYSLMRPEGFYGMKAKSAKKKFKDKSFAAKISRDDINFGLENFGKDFSEVATFLIAVFNEMPELQK